MHRQITRGIFPALALLLFTVPAPRALADLPVSVYETPGSGSTVEYSLFNGTATLIPPWAVTAFAVSTTAFAPAPSTTDAHWHAQLLLDVNFEWDQPMGGLGSGLPTWHQFTGVPLALAFPHGTLKVNGYYADFTYDSGAGLVSTPADPVKPGDAVLGGFFFNGASSSTFLAAGPTNWTAAYSLASVQNFGGDATQAAPTPEPGVLSLCAVSGLFLAWRLRKR